MWHIPPASERPGRLDWPNTIYSPPPGLAVTVGSAFWPRAFELDLALAQVGYRMEACERRPTPILVGTAAALSQPGDWDGERCGLRRPGYS